jgi:hypothetical protein
MQDFKIDFYIGSAVNNKTTYYQSLKFRFNGLYARHLQISR